MLREGHLGVHPPGALGVGFFIHAGAECFIGRTGDGITQLLKEAGTIRIEEDGVLRSVPLTNRIFTNLLEADARDALPELLFVCCNPDQLGFFTEEMTRFLEILVQRNRLVSMRDMRENVPILLILPNGILTEQTIQNYAEQLNEAVLTDRLPGVTDEMIELLLDRVVRGISLQAGGRRGSGTETVYLLEKKGSLVFAGGGEYERERIENILTAHDFTHTHIRGVPGTRIEFDKAMISIVLNVGGLIHTVKPDGELIDLRMGDLCKDPTKEEFIHEVTRPVFDVGRAIGAYPEDAEYEETWAGHRAIIMKFAGHVTSSLKTFRDELDRGFKSVKLFSNEEWLLTPLCRYAAIAGMQAEERQFKSLRRGVQQAMARAIRHRDDVSAKNGSRRRNMKLAAQRNIGIDLYDAGPDDLVLIGTFLDNDHLIKLEVNVHIPDEQITRSELDMIRVPFPVCREVESVAERLVGLQIERGVLNEINRRVGGHAGCSHIKELATNIVHFVASYLIRKRAGIDMFSSEYTRKQPEEQFVLTKDLLRDTCLAYSQTTAQGLDESLGIRRIGEEHTNPTPVGEFESSLGQVLKNREQKWNDKVYIRHRSGNRDFAVTWSEFADSVFRIARHLIAQGTKPDDRIGMICENRIEMFTFEMAAMSIGAVSVPIFAGYPPPQIAYVLCHARPRLVVVSGQHQLEKIERGRHHGIETYYCMDFDERAAAWGAVDFAELTAPGGASAEELEERLHAMGSDDLCMVMYTSGTTGPPKGVKLTHGNLISQQKAMSLLWDVGENDVFMSYLPWHHSFGGLFERFMTLYQGCELCLDDSRGRDIDRMIENWKAFGPTVFFSVPRVHDMLLTRCLENPADEAIVFGNRLRMVFTAGASLPAHVERLYRLHDIPVLEGWGLTETSPCVTATRKDLGWRSGYVGFPIPGVTVRVGSDQEILVKGPNVMQGYLDDEEATTRVLNEEGWFHTGDLGEFTRVGLRIFGRKDGAFKLTTGEKVHPQRIENILVNESPYIGTALVVGSGKDYVGVLIFPDFVRLREWAAEAGIDEAEMTTQDAFHELFASELARINALIEVKYQRIKRAVIADRDPSLERGELTPSSKIVHQRVCDSFKRELESLFWPEKLAGVIEVFQPQLQGVSASHA
ncbi:MAG: AMP-binding protein [Planctomycetes bacterium]|nr:AMP-binding protein [Planctomycetota bacterium]